MKYFKIKWQSISDRIEMENKPVTMEPAKGDVNI